MTVNRFAEKVESLAAITLAILGSTASAQTFTDTQSFEVRATVTELEALSVTTARDLDFGSIRFLVTDPGGIGEYGWTTNPVDYDGTQISCSSNAPNIIGATVDVDVISPGTGGAAVRIDGEGDAEVTVSFNGITNPSSSNATLPLVRVGGSESLLLTRIEHYRGKIRLPNTMVRTTSRNNVATFNDRLSDTGNLSLCIYGILELQNGVPAGTYTNSFTVTATYS